jgi:hypothetical protein
MLERPTSGSGGNVIESVGIVVNNLRVNWVPSRQASQIGKDADPIGINRCLRIQCCGNSLVTVAIARITTINVVSHTERTVLHDGGHRQG